MVEESKSVKTISLWDFQIVEVTEVQIITKSPLILDLSPNDLITKKIKLKLWEKTKYYPNFQPLKYHIPNAVRSQDTTKSIIDLESHP